MFDNLRDSNSGDEFFKDETPQPAPEAGPGRSRRSRSRNFLGMTAVQRFILSVMLFFVVILLGTLFLLVTGAVVLPF